MKKIYFADIPEGLINVIAEDIEKREFFSSFYGGNWLYYNGKTEANLQENMGEALMIYPFLKKDIEILAVMKAAEPEWDKAKKLHAQLYNSQLDILGGFSDGTLLYAVKGPSTQGIRSLLQTAMKKIGRNELKKELVQACAELEEYENMVEAGRVRKWAKKHPRVLEQKPKKKPKKAKPSSYDFMDLKSTVDDYEVERELLSLKPHIPHYC